MRANETGKHTKILNIITKFGKTEDCFCHVSLIKIYYFCIVNQTFDPQYDLSGCFLKVFLT